jgi:uncharacterized lipoprotein YddW (UPF0748 family)
MKNSFYLFITNIGVMVLLLVLQGCVNNGLTEDTKSFDLTRKTGTTNTLKVRAINVAEVRAVWIPDPTHTPSMRTYEDLLVSMDLLKNLNFNTIYMCVWARTQTGFDSQILLDNSTYSSKESGNFFTPYLANYNAPTASPTGDPIQDLITEAHKRNINVIFWFEYGFMSHFGTEADGANNKILQKHPEWKGIANNGSMSNYNGNNFYLNGYNPEVQNFMLSLINEAMTLYPDADGIQGDDRMPAMPRNSGYDAYTVQKYKDEHSGNNPPQDVNNTDWVNWRLGILNTFAKTFHDQIKDKKRDAWVCSSPNPYPWCKDNLMQDWPTWLSNNLVDVLSVQIYRDNITSYTNEVINAQNYVRQNTTENVLNPGIILKNGNTIMDPKLLTDQMNVNRANGTNGEAFFYIDGLTDTATQEVIRSFYVNPK